MVVFPAPFSQVNGHLLPFQADELNPAPVDQGLEDEIIDSTLWCLSKVPLNENGPWSNADRMSMSSQLLYIAKGFPHD
jgi:hypothetical protein